MLETLPGKCDKCGKEIPETANSHTIELRANGQPLEKAFWPTWCDECWPVVEAKLLALGGTE